MNSSNDKIIPNSSSEIRILIKAFRYLLLYLSLISFTGGIFTTWVTYWDDGRYEKGERVIASSNLYQYLFKYTEYSNENSPYNPNEFTLVSAWIPFIGFIILMMSNILFKSYPKYIYNIKAILKPISIFSFLGISLCFIQTINIAKDNNSSHYQSSVGPGGIFMFIALTLICVYVFSVSDHD